MKKIIRHIKKHVIRGVFAIIPLALSYFAVKFLYTTIDQRVVRLMDRVLGFSFPGLGLLLVLAALYVLGVVASNVIGKQLFGVVERITTHIPLIRTTYKVGQQLDQHSHYRGNRYSNAPCSLNISKPEPGP